MSNYGTLNTNPDHTSNGSMDSHSLLPKQDTRKSIRAHFTQPLSRTRTDLVLLFSYFITGLLDSAATVTWGSFVSMLTGNTVYFALGIVGSDSDNPTRWIRAGSSIAGFCTGAFIFSRVHRLLGERMRWVMVLSALVKTSCIVAAAWITMATTTRGKVKGGHEVHWHVILPIVLVAFQAGGQAVVSRLVKHNSLTSVVLTSIYCDLFMDPGLFKVKNGERNRRVAAPVLLVLGAVVGGLWAKTEIGITGSLWTAAGMKLLVVFAYLIWPADPADNPE